MPSILFLHLVLTHLPRCGEPVSGIILQVHSEFGDFRGCRPLGSSLPNLDIFPRFLLSLFLLYRGDPCDQFWQWASTVQCVCVCVCVFTLLHLFVLCVCMPQGGDKPFKYPLYVHGQYMGAFTVASRFRRKYFFQGLFIALSAFSIIHYMGDRVSTQFVVLMLLTWYCYDDIVRILYTK